MFGVPLLQSYLQRILKVQTVADSVDNLNYFVTSYLLAFFAFTISCKQYFGSPIQCWTPPEFRGGWEKYAENYCFIANSYHVPMDQELPEDINDRQDHISYYRWVPIMLALQAIFFYLPNYLWNIFHKNTAINPRAFLRESRRVKPLCGENREKEVAKLASYFMETVSSFGSRHRNYKHAEQRSGYNAMYLYLFTKALYVANIIGQIAVVNHFLGGDYLGWGINTANNVLHGEPWQESPIFPRVIYCDFQVRRLANIQRHSVQCVIMMNMINEKLYLFLFFWFFAVLAVTILNFVYYFMMMMIPALRYRMVLFNIDNEKNVGKRREMSRFVYECLHPDGILLLQFVREHCGGRVAYELTNKLLEIYAHDGFSEVSDEKHTPSPQFGKNQPSYFSHYGPSPTEQFYPGHGHSLQESAPLMDYTDNGTMRVSDKKSEAARSSPTEV